MGENALSHVVTVTTVGVLLSSVTGCSFPHLEQLETSMVAPWQFLPPHRGAGLSQDLERHEQELTPSAPSSLLQGCQGDHGPKPPLAVWFRSWEADSGRVKIRGERGLTERRSCVRVGGGTVPGRR